MDEPQITPSWVLMYHAPDVGEGWWAPRATYTDKAAADAACKELNARLGKGNEDGEFSIVEVEADPVFTPAGGQMFYGFELDSDNPEDWMLQTAADHGGITDDPDWSPTIQFGDHMVNVYSPADGGSVHFLLDGNHPASPRRELARVRNAALKAYRKAKRLADG